MKQLRQTMLILGILNLIGAIGVYLGGHVAYGWSALATLDYYAELELKEVINHDKLLEYDPNFTGHLALADRLLAGPHSAMSAVINFASLLLGGSGTVLLGVAISASRAALGATKVNRYPERGHTG